MSMAEYCRFFGLVACVIFALAAGCEDNAVDDPLNQVTTPGRLTVSPSSATITPDETLVVTASGGTGPYTWSVSDSSLGSVPKTTANLVTYTPVASKYGANAVIVVDSNGWNAQSVVTQVAATNAP